MSLSVEAGTTIWHLSQIPPKPAPLSNQLRECIPRELMACLRCGCFIDPRVAFLYSWGRYGSPTDDTPALPSFRNRKVAPIAYITTWRLSCFHSMASRVSEPPVLPVGSVRGRRCFLFTMHHIHPLREWNFTLYMSYGSSSGEWLGWD